MSTSLSSVIRIMLYFFQTSPNLKSTFFTLLITGTCFVGLAHSSTVKVSAVTGKTTIDLLSSIEQIETFEGEKLYLKIFIQGNLPGSAKLADGHEISHKLLLVVGEG